MSLFEHDFYPAPERGRRALTARSGLEIPSGPCATFRAPPGRAGEFEMQERARPSQASQPDERLIPAATRRRNNSAGQFDGMSR